MKGETVEDSRLGRYGEIKESLARGTRTLISVYICCNIIHGCGDEADPHRTIREKSRF